jgi:transposase
MVSMRRFQQIELPEIKPDVTEYQLFGCGCPICGQTTHASPPPEVGNRCVGPRLQALMAYMTGRMRLSRRMTGEFLEALLGPTGKVSLGCISECEADVARALAPPYAEALRHVRQSPAVNSDETSWRMQGDTAWLWVAANETVSAFRIDPSRGSEAFVQLLQGFDGILISDRWSAYQKVPLAMRQLCWAHLKRDFKKLIDRKAGAEKVGEWALREIEVIFGMWHAFLEGQIPHRNLICEFSNIKARFARLLRLGMRSKDVKASRFCKRILKAWPALWTFLRHRGTVDPTNNRAERALRPAVIWRKLSFGCQSDGGRQFVERILTTMTTLRQQGREVLQFLTHALTSLRTGMAAPSLLPVPAG